MADFATWSQENLAEFAAECWARIQELDAEVTQLKQERRVAIDAYRRLMREQDERNRTTAQRN